MELDRLFFKIKTRGIVYIYIYISLTPAETNECPLKRDYFNRKYIFQSLIFRGHVSFPRSIRGTPNQEKVQSISRKQSNHLRNFKPFKKREASSEKYRS